jgi:phthalate 4,5-dioxygenase oxygenase subunit
MLTHEENETLCRVGSETPMGKLMRHHWVPALLSEQLPEPDGTPVKVRLLGEDLVAFRDSNGKVGLLGELCPHRKASLVFGRNEDCGLRCLYHGWRFDVDGNVTDMPSEPADSGFAAKIRHKAYPTHEAAGFIWTYMGPRERMPAFEAPPWMPTEDSKVSIAKIQVGANWAQVMEGQIDSAHSSSLHSTDMRPAKVDTAKATETHWLRPSTDKNPRFRIQPTDYGFRYAAVRRPIANSATHDYIRITIYMAPFVALIPPNASYNVVSVIVPRDDDSSYFHFIAWSNTGGAPDEETWRKFCAAQPGIDLDDEYRPVLRTAANRYGQDRRAMKLGEFTGISGIPNQDIAMWESMGSISDRTTEKLGASDQAVVQFRRIMIDAAREHAKSGRVLGVDGHHVPQAKLQSWQGIVPKTEDWLTLGASEEETASIGAGARAAS